MSDLQVQVRLVLWLAFALAVSLGALVQRTHFCTLGAISDWLLMRDATRLRQWVLAVAVGMLGLGAMARMGWVSPMNTLFAMPRFPWLSYLLGGLMFGVGMVLSSGCPTKNLVRLGGGSLKALVVLLVMGMAALATLRGAPAVLRVQWLDTFSVGLATGPFIGQWLASVLGLGAEQGLWLASNLVGVLMLWLALRSRGVWQVSPVLAGAGVGVLLLACWWVSGVLGFVPEHPETLESVFVGTASGRMEGLSFSGPMAQWIDAVLYMSDGSKRLTLGMVLVPGVVLGAALAAWRHGDFCWEGFTRTSDLARHLVGAVLMGVGGVSAMGCSFGQGITGLSTLNWGSLVAVPAIVLGAVLALRVHGWWAERDV